MVTSYVPVSLVIWLLAFAAFSLRRNVNAFDSPRFGLKPTRSLFMRLVALAGLLICSSVATLRAAGDDADRFLETAKKLIKAINSDDSAAIQASFDAQMQQALPPDKATPFFRGLVTAKGKLKDAGAPQVTGPAAIVRVTAERGAWDFTITLRPSGKIAGLLITEAAAEAPAPLPPSASPRWPTNSFGRSIATIRRPSRQASTLRCGRPSRPRRPLPFSADLCPPPAS